MSRRENRIAPATARTAPAIVSAANDETSMPSRSGAP
jgi:hypothetical protein